MPRVTLTRQLARAAAQDAGNRSMRKAGRNAWNADDYDAAVAEFNRLWPDGQADGQTDRRHDGNAHDGTDDHHAPPS